MTRYLHATVDGIKIFYREAGSKTAPTILLLHGFPTSSHMFRNLIPTLAERYHVVAPDLPGFGFSDAPDRKRFRYTFENLAKVIGSFTRITSPLMPSSSRFNGAVDCELLFHYVCAEHEHISCPLTKRAVFVFFRSLAFTAVLIGATRWAYFER